MPYKINPFTGNPDFYEASSGGTVTSITAGTGLNGGTITTSGTIDLDITKVPYYSGGPLVSGFTKWNGITWVIDTNSYVNKAGDTMTGHLTLSADPTLALQAATKQYVDNLAGGGINFHEPTYGASTANLSAIYNNGVSGVGATLTATANGELILDGINYATLPVLSSPYRVLIKDQSNLTENGIYVVTDTGSSTSQYILTRATDADNSPAGELAYGDFSLNINGTSFGGYGFIMNATSPITIGTDNITYVAYNIAQGVIAGTGITESPANTINIDLTKVPYYSSFSIGLAKWDGASWVFDNTTYLDTTTAASTYLTQANAASTYYPNTNPAGYITTAALSGYVPYTGATTNVDLGAFQLTTSQLNISTKGNISSSGTNTLLVNNTATDGTTKVQFNGVDSLILKGATSTGNITNLTYNKPTRSGLTGATNINGIKIDTGISEWIDYSNLPLIQKEIEILGPTYNMTTGLIPAPGSEEFYTLYINPPTVQTWGVFGNALGIYGNFQMKGDATDYPLGTVLDIGGDGLGTMIGFTGAKLSFFGNPPIVKPAAVTTVQGLSDALSNLGLIAPSTIVGYVPYTGATADVNLGTYSLTTPNLIGGSAVGSSLTYKGTTGNGTSTLSAHNFLVGNNGATTAMQIFNSGRVNIGNYATPANQRLVTIGQDSAYVSIGSLTTVAAAAAIYMNTATPTGGNYVLMDDTTNTYVNGRNGNLYLQAQGNNLVRINTSFQLHTPIAATSGILSTFTFTVPANTGATANTPVSGVKWNLGSRQWAAGPITQTQKEFELTSPTYSFTSASTITDAYSLYVNAPTAGTNATITNNYALGLKGGLFIDNYVDGVTSISSTLFSIKNSAGATAFTIDNSFLKAQFYGSGGINYPSITSTANTNNGIGFTASQLSLIINNSSILTLSATDVTIKDGINLILGSTNGTKIGTATTQKLGFFNATPIVQPAAVTTIQGLADALGSTTGLGLIASSTLSAYQTVQEEGVSLTQRPTINFIGASITATDDVANNRTNVTVASILSYSSFSSSTAQNVISSTFTLITGSNSIPAAGTYLVQCIVYANCNNNNSILETALFYNNVQQSNTSVILSTGPIRGTLSSQMILVADGTSTFEVRIRAFTATAISQGFYLTLLKIA